MRKAKIVATLGPATDKVSITGAILASGVNVARLNMSHGTHEQHRERCESGRKAALGLGLPLAVLVDLQGPKIRTGVMQNSPALLLEGQRFTLTSKDIKGDEHRVSTNYKQLSQECEEGEFILLDDGKIRLAILSTTETDVVTKVLVGGELHDRKAINLPGITVSAPSLTKKDIDDLNFAIKELKADFIALSFVRSADDIRAIKTLMKDLDSHAGLIAKIEKPEAVDNIDEILEALDLGDGVMIARGDLGVEVKIHKVPAIQKNVIKKANRMSLICITATQMLESMMSEPMPSRAEASDIFNAILDGSDAAMLSGETAIGNNPVESVTAMELLISEAEGFIDHKNVETVDPLSLGLDIELATCLAACTAAESSGAKALVALTRSGRTALMMSKLALPFKVPFYALTAEEATYNKMALFYGVIPVMMSRRFDPKNEMWEIVDDALLKQGTLERGDTVVIASGYQIGSGHTNVCKIVKLGLHDYY